MDDAGVEAIGFGMISAAPHRRLADGRVRGPPRAVRRPAGPGGGGLAGPRRLAARPRRRRRPAAGPAGGRALGDARALVGAGRRGLGGGGRRGGAPGRAAVAARGRRPGRRPAGGLPRRAGAGRAGRAAGDRARPVDRRARRGDAARGARVRAPRAAGARRCGRHRGGGMRAVAARVTEASVRVGGEVVGAIEGPGLLVLLGVHRDDTAAAASVMGRKLHELRILDGERSCADVGAPLLVVSQFTLYGDTRKGRRPTWQAAAPPALAEPLVDAVVAELRARGATVATGVFGADMAVASVNDGPFTVLVEVSPHTRSDTRSDTAAG